jgi:excisionase family DNA binding protein
VTDADEPSDLLLSTGEVARLLGSSRQHVVDLCERGTLPCESIGTHRRIRASDVMAFQQAGERQRPHKDIQRSLWLHTAVAGKVVTNPDRAIKLAHRNLDKLLAARPRAQAAQKLRRWNRLLRGPVDDVIDALTSPAQRSVELRQHSPFTDLLTDHEQRRILAAFSKSHR